MGRHRFTLPGLEDLGSADDIIGGLEYYADWKAKEEQRKREAEEKARAAAEFKRQNDLSEQRQKAKEDREARDFEDQRAQRRQQQVGEIEKRFYEGDDASAEAYAKAGAYVDPVTGERKSFGFERSHTPEFSPARLDEPDVGRPEEQKFFPSLISKLRGPMDAEAPQEPPPEIRGLKSMLGMGLRKPEYAPNDGRGPQAQLEQYQGDLANADKPAIVTPEGERIYLDREARARYQQKKRDEQAAALEHMAADSTLSSDVRQKAALQAQMLRGGLAGSEKASVNATADMENKQRHEEALKKQYDMTAAQKFDLATRRINKVGAGKAKDPVKAQKDAEDLLIKKGVILAKVDSAVQQYITNQGYREIRGDYETAQKIRDMSGLAVDNGMAAALTRGWMARWAQGAGVLTESDLNTFYNNVGSYFQRNREAIQNFFTGELTPEKQQVLDEAIQKTIAQTQGRRMALGEGIVNTMADKEELYGGDRERWKLATATKLRNYSPGYLTKFEQDFGPVNYQLISQQAAAGALPGQRPSHAPSLPAGAPATSGVAPDRQKVIDELKRKARERAGVGGQ